MKVVTEIRERIFLIGINRPQVRNAVDGETAQQLAEAFRKFDNDDAVDVAILYGEGGHFCAGADLKAIASDEAAANRLLADGDGPMGPSRMLLSKPTIAAIEGHAVAGGLELALWCDLRVAASNATFGVFCRRFGVPLIDGGTVRLPRLVGMSRAMDMILTGRAVDAQEAFDMGLANRLCPQGESLSHALALAKQISRFPQGCLRSDRMSCYEQWSLAMNKALSQEFAKGMQVVKSGETRSGAQQFHRGKGRGGGFADS